MEAELAMESGDEGSRGNGRSLSHSDMRILRALLGRYAARYHLSGPEKDDLIERTFNALAANPEIFFDSPVEKAAAETMDRIHADGR